MKRSGPAEYQVGLRPPSHSSTSSDVGLSGNATLPPVINGVKTVT